MLARLQQPAPGNKRQWLGLLGLDRELQEQGSRLFFPGRVQDTNALDHLSYHWRLGRIGKALGDMPLGSRSSRR